ncbi:hypothetical protein A2Z22_05215 [Candidatus Woesebacteria bacterium RBG_16_34_12]|uniref:Response regulatory domain-containing protein n=1 Tax=Candidatus Woesebacteria bacterium RBG_16_34_12 TaxID=1802480 RepID=A0A1F7XCS3_9BACT|nr:MAG: hypothetical protein A2Z22_05215 [Candidatus Woesebacteria bacterium RBG_16_34_12]
MTKVLIVEDEDIVARMYEKALKFNNFEVEVAIGGNEGLEKVKSFKPDLVLLDIMMPEPDGMEVLEKIKSDPETSGLPIVMLTNLSGKHDAEHALSKGAIEYWVKSSVDIKDLGGMINNIVNEKHPENQSN